MVVITRLSFTLPIDTVDDTGESNEVTVTLTRQAAEQLVDDLQTELGHGVRPHRSTGMQFPTATYTNTNATLTPTVDVDTDDELTEEEQLAAAQTMRSWDDAGFGGGQPVPEGPTQTLSPAEIAARMAISAQVQQEIAQQLAEQPRDASAVGSGQMKRSRR
jgi:hypothetical protein